VRDGDGFHKVLEKVCTLERSRCRLKVAAHRAFDGGAGKFGGLDTRHSSDVPGGNLQTSEWPRAPRKQRRRCIWVRSPDIWETVLLRTLFSAHRQRRRDNDNPGGNLQLFERPRLWKHAVFLAEGCVLIMVPKKIQSIRKLERISSLLRDGISFAEII
jgi:hypothetical protein